MIVADVAFASGRSLAAVAADAFFWTLYALLHLRRREVRDARVRDAEGLRAAVRSNYAFAAPEQLQQEISAQRTNRTAMPSAEDAKSHGARVLQAAIAAGWVAQAPLPDPAGQSEVRDA